MGLWSWKLMNQREIRLCLLDWMMFNTGLRKIFPLKRSIYYHNCLGRRFRSRSSGVKSVRPHLVTKSILFTPQKSNMTMGKSTVWVDVFPIFQKWWFCECHASFNSGCRYQKTAIFFQGVQLLVCWLSGMYSNGGSILQNRSPVTVSPLVVLGPMKIKML